MTRVSIFSHYFSCSWVQTTAPESEQHKSEDEMSGSSAIVGSVPLLLRHDDTLGNIDACIC
ncbi:hypothetical protein GQ55_7G122200 [Panicum hallii var. hallii]|uniref:Uncharacterized protein n=1 Tax=Panicum hallii var. hallii TaxID=1504633 RepID=A0A2T7CUA4_9POAL|nr:hypothetical protein GQ55_7G122200 [Panicum hallii var. hallii]